jgi:hypothetical protein
VNQDCTYRRQAEEEITFNPADPNNLAAGQNDSRLGFNQCGYDFSTDNGKGWGDDNPPFRQKVNAPAFEEPTAADPNRHTIAGGDGTFHTYDAGSDPAVTFDSRGRAFFSCIGFDIFYNAALLYVTQSPIGAEGSFYRNLAMFGRNFVVAEDNDARAFHDKEFIIADTYASSPNRDNVYVTWTVFNFTCGPDQTGYCSSEIYGSMSTNNGVTWSTPQVISGSNSNLCRFGDFFTGNASDVDKCNFDQGSDPVVLPNGDLEVIFNNGNTPSTVNQQLGVHCHPTGRSEAGTATLNCGPPTLVGNDVATGEPQCDFGRGPEECIPGAFIRTNDYPRILTTNPQNNHLYAVWQDYRNAEYDIQMSQSLDGGLTWHEVGTVNPDRGLDHYFAAIDMAKVNSGDDRLGVSYYRTERVPNENQPSQNTFTGGAIFAPCNAQGQPPAGAELCAGVQRGNSDYVLSGGRDARLPYDFKVVSIVFPPPDGIQAGFNGDYSGLVINKGTDAHPIWSDTRNVDPYAPTNGVVHDEDVFTDNVGLPDGKASSTTGTIGKR